MPFMTLLQPSVTLPSQSLVRVCCLHSLFSATVWWPISLAACGRIHSYHMVLHTVTSLRPHFIYRTFRRFWMFGFMPPHSFITITCYAEIKLTEKSAPKYIITQNRQINNTGILLFFTDKVAHVSWENTVVREDANTSYSRFIDSFHFHVIKYFQLLPKELKFATNLGLQLNCHNKVITKEKELYRKG